MTSKTLTLAALMIATGALSTTAQAGGVRLSMAGPLGSFIAHPHLSSGPGGTMRREHCAKDREPRASYAKPSYVGRYAHDDDAPVRKIKRSVPKVEVAEEAPAPRKIKKAAPQEVKTAKLEDKTTATDAAPAIFVPESPPVADVYGTQSTPATTRSAALEPAAATTTVTATEPETVKTETKAEVTETKPEEPKAAETKPEKAAKTEKPNNLASKICRRFSAAVASLIEVPCGE